MDCEFALPLVTEKKNGIPHVNNFSVQKTNVSPIAPCMDARVFYRPKKSASKRCTKNEVPLRSSIRFDAWKVVRDASSQYIRKRRYYVCAGKIMSKLCVRMRTFAYACGSVCITRVYRAMCACLHHDPRNVAGFTNGSRTNAGFVGLQIESFIAAGN